MKNTTAKLILFLNFFLTWSAYGQENFSEGIDEWTPSYGFPSCAVVKLDEKNVLQILLPSATVANSNAATHQATEEYNVEENGVMVAKTRTISRFAHYLPDKFRMVRTELTSDKIKLRDRSGKVLDLDQLSESLRKPTYVVLVQGGSINSFRQNYFLDDVLVLSPTDLDPNCWYFPEVVGLATKWIRTEPIPIAAVAQLVENQRKLQVKFIEKSDQTETRERHIQRPDGGTVTENYNIAVPTNREIIEVVDLQDCNFTTVAGSPLEQRAALERLSQRTHVFWESSITEYLGSVLKPDTIVINRKSSPASASK